MQFMHSEMTKAIALAMGDTEVTRYVVHHADGSLVMAFMDGNVESRELAQGWIDRMANLGMDTEGWIVAPEQSWPDYINMTSHAARFINWGIQRLDASQLQSLQFQWAGGSVQAMLATILFPEACC